MAENQTDKSRYPSRYSPEGFVTAAQYIIELLCENKAKKYGTGDLPIRFWTLPEWADEFKSQLRAVHKLLKLYPEQAIINAIRAKRHFSARPKFVVDQIKAEADKIKLVSALNSSMPKILPNIVDKPKVKENRDSVLDKLSKLDG